MYLLQIKPESQKHMAMKYKLPRITNILAVYCWKTFRVYNSSLCEVEDQDKNLKQNENASHNMQSSRKAYSKLLPQTKQQAIVISFSGAAITYPHHICAAVLHEKYI
jgi:hypothetical protein